MHLEMTFLKKIGVFKTRDKLDQHSAMSLHPTKTVKKLLSCAHWSLMQLGRAVDQPEGFAKLAVKF